MLCLIDFNIDYLDIALSRTKKKIIKIEQFTHKCYFVNLFKHNMHGDNPQLNSIIDMLISLGTHLEEQGKTSLPKNKISSNLHYNIEYDKSQNNDIRRIIGATKSNFSSSHNLRDLDKRYNEIKQLLEEIKHLTKT